MPNFAYAANPFGLLARLETQVDASIDSFRIVIPSLDRTKKQRFRAADSMLACANLHASATNTVDQYLGQMISPRFLQLWDILLYIGRYRLVYCIGGRILEARCSCMCACVVVVVLVYGRCCPPIAELCFACTQLCAPPQAVSVLLEESRKLQLKMQVLQAW